VPSFVLNITTRRWLSCVSQVKDNVILADEMGLGKTIQAIAYLGALWQVRGRLDNFPSHKLCRGCARGSG
jgi:SNF2 family DNA or RNA helicase